MVRINTKDATGIEKYHNAEDTDDPDFSGPEGGIEKSEPKFPEGIDPYCMKTKEEDKSKEQKEREAKFLMDEKIRMSGMLKEWKLK